MAYLATLFVLIIIVAAFKITALMDRRDEQRKGRADKNKKGKR